ncbi:Na(+)/H(+) antiporter subunit E [compost metagenome]
MNVAGAVYVVLGFAVWYALIGRMGPVDAVFGGLVVGSSWLLYRRVSELPNHVPVGRVRVWLVGLVRYLVVYVGLDMIRSTARVFTKVLQPPDKLAPAIVAVHLPEASRAGLIVLAYGIALTPGEMIVDIDEERRMVYVHSIDAPDPEALRARILGQYERYIKEATEWS